MKDFSGENFVMMPVPASMFAAVCAVLGGAAMSAPVATAAASRPAAEPAKAPEPKPDAPAGAAEASGGAGAGDASGDADLGTDAGGHPWSAELHAGTKSKTGEGLWRMKVGQKRPDHLPGSPAATALAEAGAKAAGNGGTGTASDGAGSSASGTVATGDAGAADEDDEFAAFAAASAKAAGTDAAAAASVPARKWTDADLGKLTNQAAVKLGDPAPIKELIAKHVGEGNVAHSRNIPEDKREAFAQDVEAKAGITFEG